MSKQASLKSFLSIQKDLPSSIKGQKRTQGPLTRNAVKKQKLTKDSLDISKTPIQSSPKKVQQQLLLSNFSSPSSNKIQTKIDTWNNTKDELKEKNQNIEKIIDDPIKEKPKEENEIKKVEEKILINKKEDLKNITLDNNENKTQINKISGETIKVYNHEVRLNEIKKIKEKIKNNKRSGENISLQSAVRLKIGIQSTSLSKNIIPLLPSERKLKLPEKFQKLQKIFEAIDHVLRYDKAMNRQCILFRNLIKRLENICKSNITDKHLGQILAVYPDSYSLRAFRSKDGSINWYIDFNSTTSALQQAIEAGKFAEIRRKTFRKNLLNYVHIEHDKYLKENGFQPIDHETLTEWNANFNLESVPDIIPANLPIPPIFKNEKEIEKRILESKPREPKPLIKIQDKEKILNQQGKILLKNNDNSKDAEVSSLDNKTLSNVTPINDQKEKIVSNLPNTNNSIPSPTTLPATTSTTSTSLTLSMDNNTSKIENNSNSTNSNTNNRVQMKEKISALRLRLREKDRLRKLKQIKSPEEIRKSALIGRLPEIIKTLKKYYTSKKTTSLPYNEVRNMLQISCSVNSLSGIDEHIKLLTSISIECCRKVPTVNYGTYLKFFPEKSENALKKITEIQSKESQTQ